MRLSRTFTLVLVSAFVLPTVAVTVFGRNALLHAETGAAEEAQRISLDAERERLVALSQREAGRIDANLALLQLDVTHLAEAYGRAEVLPSTAAQRRLAVQYADRETLGLPAYGFVHRTYGAYGDFLHLGPQSPWIPRAVLSRLGADPGLRALLSAELHRVSAVGPEIAEIGRRYGDRLDLIWVVTESGAANVWPPYDYDRAVAENPGVLDLDESSMDYVRIGAPDVNPTRGPRWTDPYLDRFKGVWMTSAVHPLYVGDAFHGTAGADLLLATITGDVATVDLGVPGYPMLLGPHGEIIATTLAGVEAVSWDADWQAALRESLRAPEEQRWTPERDSAMQRGRLSEAPDPAWRALAADALGPAGLSEARIGGTDMILAHAPLPTAGWGLVVVTPKADILSRADRVGAVVSESARELMGDFSIFATATLVLTVASALLLQHITIRPLRSLTRRVSTLTFDNLRLEEEPGGQSDEFDALESKVRELLALLSESRDGERAEHARIEAILGSIADAVVATDARGIVLRANPGAERLLGKTQAGLTGRPFGELAAVEREVDGRRLDDPVATVLAAGRPTVFRERLLLRRGVELVPVELRGAPLLGQAGVVLVLSDASETRRFEDQLVRAQKLETVQLLASGIAHDFNNLLAGVLGYVSLARMVIAPDSEAQPRLTRAEQAIERGRGLTQQLLTFAAGGAPVRDAADLAEVVKDAARLPLRGTEVELELELPTELWTAPFDAGQIGQVVQNLVANAAQALEGVGTVHIRAENVQGSPGGLPEGRYVAVHVRDSGPGIPADVQARIFDPFFTTRPGASGLGLAVCFSVVRKHHGNIEVRSSPGAGACFTFWLPAGEPSSRTGPGPGAGEPDTGAVRVLVMDDDADLLEITTAMLQRLGHAAVGVSCGEAAVDMVRSAKADGRPFALVLLDLTIPGGMGGVEAVPHLRAVDPALRAIVCSGYGRDAALADPQAWGFDGKLRKPFDLNALRAEVERVLTIDRGAPTR